MVFQKKELVNAITLVLENPPYYNSSVSQTIKNKILNDFLLDKIDRRLLYQLSIGTKTTDLPEILPPSIARVEKRKRNFNISNLDDKGLITIVKEKVFI